jgi:translation initiation factor 4E
LRDAGKAVAHPTPGPAAPPAHQLRNSWVFWFRPPISKANGFIEYEKTLHPIATVETVEHFFGVYQHLKRPSSLPLVSDYHLFKKGIRPIWEDEENKNGGKWVVRLRKGVADRYWEDLLLAIIGDQFGEASEEVCGAVLSVRNGEDILSIWARANGQRVLKIR